MVKKKSILSVMGNCVQNGGMYSPVADGYHILTREHFLEAGMNEDDLKIPDNKYTSMRTNDLAGRDILAIACHEELGCVVYFEKDGECRNVGRRTRGIPVDWAIPKKVSTIAIEYYGWDERDLGRGE